VLSRFWSNLAFEDLLSYSAKLFALIKLTFEKKMLRQVLQHERITGISVKGLNEVAN
jgi:hypothetical protein